MKKFVSLILVLILSLSLVIGMPFSVGARISVPTLPHDYSSVSEWMTEYKEQRILYGDSYLGDYFFKVRLPETYSLGKFQRSALSEYFTYYFYEGEPTSERDADIVIVCSVRPALSSNPEYMYNYYYPWTSPLTDDENVYRKQWIGDRLVLPYQDGVCFFYKEYFINCLSDRFDFSDPQEVERFVNMLDVQMIPKSEIVEKGADAVGTPLTFPDEKAPFIPRHLEGAVAMVGGVVALVCVVLLILCFVRKKKKKELLERQKNEAEPAWRLEE